MNANRVFRRVAAAATAIWAAALLSACGTQKPALCMYLDAAGSTGDLRQTYLADLEQRATQAAAAGRPIRILVGTGAPLTESLVRTASFGDVSSQEQLPERTARLTDLIGKAEADAINADLHIADASRGSSIAAGMAQVANNGACKNGDLVAYTDGLQNVTISVYNDDILTPTGRDELMNRLQAAGAIARLDGATVEVPFGGKVPRGSILSGDRKAALPALFRDWTKRSGGRSLEWGL